MLNDRDEILFRGRRDSLIKKHMGCRIELGEVENVILGTLDNVRNCCATYQHEEKRLFCFTKHPDQLTNGTPQANRYTPSTLYSSSRLPVYTENAAQQQWKELQAAIEQSIEQDKKFLTAEYQS